jgi:hypothetical protein
VQFAFILLFEVGLLSVFLAVRICQISSELVVLLGQRGSLVFKHLDFVFELLVLGLFLFFLGGEFFERALVNAEEVGKGTVFGVQGLVFLDEEIIALFDLRFKPIYFLADGFFLILLLL